MYNPQYGQMMGSCNPASDYNLLNDIVEYINDELKDAKYYEVFASKAPTPRSKQLLLDFAKDERQHAQNFMNVYKMMTGRDYTPPQITGPVVPEYLDALKARTLAETGDYKKYNEKYIAACNPYLKNLFYMTAVTEAQHAMRMPIMFND